MAYVRFLGDEAVHKAIVIPNEDENIVTLKFEKEKEVNTSGFNLFLDEDCEVDIGGDSYRGYTTNVTEMMKHTRGIQWISTIK